MPSFRSAPVKVRTGGLVARRTLIDAVPTPVIGVLLCIARRDSRKWL